MGSPRVSPLAHIFRGSFVHSSSTSPLDILHGHLLGVEESGKIAFLKPVEEQEKLAKKWGFKSSEIRELNNNEFFMPGLVDTHIHAPQYAFSGTRVDLPLLQWLKAYTYPTETKYKDSDFAEEVYTRAVRRTLKNGTTTACYFATIHTDASLLLADITDKFGQRAFVGKVCMDINECYPDYKETTSESIKETERFVQGVLEKKYPRVHPIVTPRFGPSCTEEMLGSLGDLAKAHDIHVQSHVSETEEEIKLVEKMFPTYQNYTELYDKNKLLTNKTILAHGCHLSDEELQHLTLRGTAIAHCPNSNIALCSGFLNVRKVLKYNVKLGLGTDVAGGYSASMFDAIRKAVIVSNALKISKENEEGLTLKEAFRLATLGGSQALGIDAVIGNFEVGKEFDALLINTKASDSPFDLFASDTFEDIIQKFLYLGDDRNIEEVYVAGKLVVPFSSSV
ncbi:guanine deaminase [Sphaerodactylus townsendi]|uniref:guanine deaminase n=1 Tax=Sphaerodactylus townsendi TaxID=933632 RepID=UPI002025B703|nr:guanine deaminase [Sphaerodactylus townsendi]